MTRNMEISVPRLRHWPMPTMDGSVVICPMRKPAADRMEPEVSTVGKDRSSALIRASLELIRVLRSEYQVEMTMA